MQLRRPRVLNVFLRLRMYMHSLLEMPVLGDRRLLRRRIRREERRLWLWLHRNDVRGMAHIAGVLLHSVDVGGRAWRERHSE